jgi:amino acid transporter
MNVINGLPAHALLLHAVVVLVPLTALLEIVCGLWPAARRGQLLWLTLVLAAATMVLTPLTINAGQWLYGLREKPSPILQEHAERGSTMVYFSAALLVVAIGLVALRLVERRSERRRMVTHVIVGIIVLAVGISSTIQVYRTGDAGAQSVWGGEIARLKKSNGT